MGEKELRQAFMAALPDRVVGLEMAYENWRLAQEDAEQALEQFYRLSHNLAGAAALYGFEQVSAPCRALECYLRSLMRSNDGEDLGDGDCVTHMLVTIRNITKLIQQESGREAG